MTAETYKRRAQSPIQPEPDVSSTPKIDQNDVDR